MINNILIVNDDGIRAKGIEILKNIAKKFFPQAKIWVIAPNISISGAGRSLTFGEGKSTRVENLGNNRYMVTGTPADCVEISRAMGVKFDLCLSGINHGFNQGDDIPISGTVGAASHAHDFLGIPAWAFSAHSDCFKDKNLLAYHVYRVMERLWKESNCEPAGIWNVNIPNSQVNPIIVTTKRGHHRKVNALEPMEMTQEYSDVDENIKYYEIMGNFEVIEASDDDPETDVGALAKGLVSITRLA